MTFRVTRIRVEYVFAFYPHFRAICEKKRIKRFHLSFLTVVKYITNSKDHTNIILN